MGVLKQGWLVFKALFIFRLNNLHVLCMVEGRLRVGQTASDFALSLAE